MADKVEYAGLDKAIAIVSVAFEGDYDKGGVPYIQHCLHVSHQVKHLGEQAEIAAVLHDLLEDKKDWTAQRLIDEGFDPRTVEIVVLLTHKKGEPYMDYVRRLSVSRIARAIKMADLRHNSDIHRMKPEDVLVDDLTMTKKAADRLAKYYVAYAYLRGIED